MTFGFDAVANGRTYGAVVGRRSDDLHDSIVEDHAV